MHGAVAHHGWARHLAQPERERKQQPGDEFICLARQRGLCARRGIAGGRGGGGGRRDHREPRVELRSRGRGVGGRDTRDTKRVRGLRGDRHGNAGREEDACVDEGSDGEAACQSGGLGGDFAGVACDVCMAGMRPDRHGFGVDTV